MRLAMEFHHRETRLIIQAGSGGDAELVLVDAR